MKNGPGSHLLTDVSWLANGVATYTKRLTKYTSTLFLNIARDLPLERWNRRGAARNFGDFFSKYRNFTLPNVANMFFMSKASLC